MGSDQDDARQPVQLRLKATVAQFDAQAARFVAARERLQATIDQMSKSLSWARPLRESAYLRLHAQVVSMPVIEQAKGILMAQNQCGPDEAFDLLRRTSQHANTKVSVLAAQIIRQAAAPNLNVSKSRGHRRA